MTLTVEADRGHNQHPARLDGRRRPETPPGFPENRHGRDQQQLRVDERREHFRAREPEGVPGGRSPVRQRHSRPRERQGRDVGEHVRGVGEERQTSRPQASGEFDQEHAGRQQQRGFEPTSPPEAHGRRVGVEMRVRGWCRGAHAMLAGETSTRASLKQAPPPRSASVSGASAVAVVPLAVLWDQSPLGRKTTPGFSASDRRAMQRTSPSALWTRTRSPSEMPRAAASEGCISRATSARCSSPSVELIVRSVAGEISASGNAAVAGSGR